MLNRDTSKQIAKSGIGGGSFVAGKGSTNLSLWKVPLENRWFGFEWWKRSQDFMAVNQPKFSRRCQGEPCR